MWRACPQPPVLQVLQTGARVDELLGDDEATAAADAEALLAQARSLVRAEIRTAVVRDSTGTPQYAAGIVVAVRDA